MSRLSFTLAITLGLAVAGCDRGASDAAQESTASPAPTGRIDASQAGELFPEFRLSSVSDGILTSSAYAGHPTLINLWATWCAPCVKEMPLLDQLASDYEGRLKVLTISQDLKGVEAVGPFFARNEFTHLETWIDPENYVGDDIGGGFMPTTVLYVRGEEVWRVQGDYDWSSEEARAAIDAAIAE